MLAANLCSPLCIRRRHENRFRRRQRRAEESEEKRANDRNRKSERTEESEGPSAGEQTREKRWKKPGPDRCCTGEINSKRRDGVVSSIPITFGLGPPRVHRLRRVSRAIFYPFSTAAEHDARRVESLPKCISRATSSLSRGEAREREYTAPRGLCQWMSRCIRVLL